MADLLDNAIDPLFRIRDVSELFALARAEENPFSSMAKKGAKPKSSLFEFPWKRRHTPSDNAVSDGVDVQDAEVINNESNKFMIQARVQKGRVVIGVTDIANELGEEYAVQGTLLADNVADGLILARENLEVTCLKAGDSIPYASSSVPNRTRGLTSWIRSANPGSPDLPIPTAALTPGANILTGKAAATDITEDDVRGIMLSIASTQRRSGTWDVFVTPAFKAVFSGWARTGIQSATTLPLRRFNTDMKDKTISLDIQVYESDFGKLRLHTHFSLPAGVHALFVDMGSVELRPVRNPMMKPLEYRGGGYRRMIEYITGLQCSNPQSHGKVTT